MPWEVRKSGDGYKVFKKGKGKSYSKKPMSKEKAEAQMAAMYANVKEDVEGSFIGRIDEALGISEITKGPTLGATQQPFTGNTGSSETKLKKKKKKKAAQIEDEVLEAG